MKQMEMKQKFLAALLMVGAGLLSACSLDDSDLEADEWKPKTETWEMIVKPEYVMGHSSWGVGGVCFPQIEAFNEKDEQLRFLTDEIEGFTFEEGYLYFLLVDATTTDPRIMDGPGYTYKLNKVLHKVYVGISQEGRREVTMDVQLRRMHCSDLSTSQSRNYLYGKSIDGSETLNLGLSEIYGLFNELFLRNTIHGDILYMLRLKLSITPTERPIYGKHQFRVRLEELISEKEIPLDSLDVLFTKEEFESIESELYSNQNEI